MISEDEKKSLRGPSAKRRLFLFLRHSFVWVLAGVILLWLSSFLFIKSIAEEKIRGLCGGAAYVHSGRLKLFGGIRLEGVVIAKDAASLADEPILQADELEIKLDPWQLLRRKFQVHSIQLSDLFLGIDYDDDSEKWNVQQLTFQRSSGPTGKLPLVTIRNGAVRIRRLTSERTQLITTFGLNGQIAADTDKGQYSFSLQADGGLGFAGSQLQGVFRLADDSKPGLLGMQGRLAMPGAKIFDNAWNLENIQFECEFEKHQIALKHCHFSLGEGSVDVHGVFEEAADQQHTVNLDVDVQQLTLSDQYEPDAIVYSEPLLELLGERLSRFLKNYHPKGVGDLVFSVSGQPDDPATIEMNGAVVCRDISILNEKFPYSIDHLTGRVELAGRDLYLKELTGVHGDVELAVDGAIYNIGADHQTDIRFASPNMRFDEDLYTALNDSVKKVWFSFSPSGRAGLDYRYQRFEDGRHDTTLKLELKGAALVYDQFPYPLENLTGNILVEPDYVEFVDLVSHYEDDRKVTLNGNVLELRSEQPNFKIHVDAERIPVNQLLINAMPVQQRVIFDQLHIDPDSAADLNVNLFRNEVGKRKLDFIANVNLQSRHLVYDGFSLPMNDVYLDVDITNESVRLNHFEGVSDGGQIQMSGQLHPTGDDASRPQVCLDLNLDNFALDETFWAAVGSDANDMLGDLRMQGRVDVDGRLVLNAIGDSCSGTDLVIHCSDNPVLWAGQELARADGQLHWVNEMVYLDQFSLQRLMLESLPDKILSDRVREVYRPLDPSGMISVKVHEGFMQMHPEGIQKMNVTADLKFENVAGGQEKKFHELYGQADLELLADFESNYCRVLAKFDVDHFLWEEYLLSDLRGQIVYDPDTMHLESHDFTADLYGGEVTGEVDVDFGDPNRVPYLLTLSLAEANIEELFAAEYEQTREKVIAGTISGTLGLQGDFRQLDHSHGTVNANVQNIKLGKQSIMGQVLTGMQLRTPTEFVFNEIQIEATIQGLEVNVDNARLVGDPFVFRGTGKLYLADKQIAMDLVAFDRFIGQEDTILDRLARGIGQALWKVEIRGDMSQPKIETVYFSVLKQPLNIFRKKKE